jgi:predicted ribosomally synthesized peptide with SipW-like signal peptide
MKKKIIISSILTIAICLGVITGATYALFTSKTETNIAVTAGKIDVTARIDTTPSSIIVHNGSYDAATSKGSFENGGTAQFTSNKITLNNITPGDGVKFNIKVNNGSNVGIKYVVVCKINPQSEFYGKIKVQVNGVDIGNSYQSNWATWNSTDTLNVSVNVILPTTVEGTGAEFEGGIANDITFTVYAIQANVTDTQANEWLSTVIG